MSKHVPGRAATADPAITGGMRPSRARGVNPPWDESPVQRSKTPSLPMQGTLTRPEPAPMLPLSAYASRPSTSHAEVRPDGSLAGEADLQAEEYAEWGFASVGEESSGRENTPVVAAYSGSRWLQERPWSQASMRASRKEAANEGIRYGMRGKRRAASAVTGLYNLGSPVRSAGSLFAAPGQLERRKEARVRPKTVPVEDRALHHTAEECQSPGKGRTDCGVPGVHYKPENSKPVRDKITGGVISLKEVQNTLKKTLRKGYNKLRKEMHSVQLFMPGPPAFEMPMEIDLAPLVEATGFSEMELYNLVQDFLKVSKPVKTALDPAEAAKKAMQPNAALASKVVDWPGFKQLMAGRLYSLPQVLRRIWRAMDNVASHTGEGEVRLIDDNGAEIEVMTFSEVAKGLMYFKENAIVAGNLAHFLAQDEFRETVVLMFCNQADIDVISKLCLYAMLSRFPRSEQYELADALWEIISEDGSSLYANEFHRRFEECGELYPNQFKPLMYYIVLMQGAAEASACYNKCKERIMSLTEDWRRNKADYRFVFLDRVVCQFKEATDAKDEDAIQRCLDISIAFSNKKRGMENVRASYYVKVMREIRRNGWSYAEEELERIQAWLREKGLDTEHADGKGKGKSAREARRELEAELDVDDPRLATGLDQKKAMLLEQLKSGVMKAYHEQILMARQRKEQAAEEKRAKAEAEQIEEANRVAKARARGYLA